MLSTDQVSPERWGAPLGTFADPAALGHFGGSLYEASLTCLKCGKSIQMDQQREPRVFMSFRRGRKRRGGTRGIERDGPEDSLFCRYCGHKKDQPVGADAFALTNGLTPGAPDRRPEAAMTAHFPTPLSKQSTSSHGRPFCHMECVIEVDRVGAVHLGALLGHGGQAKVMECSLETPSVATVGKFYQDVGPATVSVLFMELCDISLQQIISQKFREAEAAFVCCSVLKALNHLHRHRILHRDVKPANILLADAGTRVVLSDFGLAAYLPTSSDTLRGPFCGTRGYTAPECSEADSLFSHEADVFALGVVLYFLLFRTYPFRSWDQCLLLGESPWSFVLEPCGRAVGRSESSCRLIRHCLALDRPHRPSAAQALESAWFQEVDAWRRPSRLHVEVRFAFL
eukprot:g15181.t1